MTSFIDIYSNLVNREGLHIICLEIFEMRLQVLLFETSFDKNGPVCLNLLEFRIDCQERRKKSWDSFKNYPRKGIQLQIGGTAFKIY